MTKTSRTAFLWFRSDNRKSKIQNPKWVGLWSSLRYIRNVRGCGRGAAAEKDPRIGYLIAPSLSANSTRIEALRQGLRELGYIEGKNIIIELAICGGKTRTPPFARD